MEGIAIAGEKIAKIILELGYYVTLIGGIGDAIKHITKKDPKGAISAVLQFGAAFAALFAMRWILDLVKVTFG